MGREGTRRGPAQAQGTNGCSLAQQGRGEIGPEAELSREAAGRCKLHRIEVLHVRDLRGSAIEYRSAEARLAIEWTTNAGTGSQRTVMGCTQRFVTIAQMDVGIGCATELHRRPGNRLEYRLHIGR